MRRSADPQRGIYVDLYGVRLLTVILMIVLLSLLDALLTLYGLHHGAQEVNLLLRLTLHWGPRTFFLVKYSLTALGLLVLTVLKNFPGVREMLIVLLLLYCGVIAYHLYYLLRL